jgi:signal transduction histidine kinase/ActR/RegA family two-component response regulator
MNEKPEPIHPSLKAWIAAVIAFTLLVTGVWAFYLHKLLLTPEHISSIIGPEEGYYWTAAQYQVAYLRMEHALLHYKASHGKNTGDEDLVLRYDVLKSKYKILTDRTELTLFFEKVPQYNEAREPLRKLMGAIDQWMARLQTNSDAVDALISVFDNNLDLITSLANSVRIVEMEHREQAIDDFKNKRGIIFISSVTLSVFFLLTIILLLLVGKRQKAALLSEREAARSKNVFLGMISHELRTPLQTIISSIDILTSRQHDERNTKVIRRLESAALRLDTQMKDLTDYARLGAGKLELRKSLFNVQHLIQDIVEEHAVISKGKLITIIYRDTHCPTMIQSDPDRIRQIISNLLTNALKYSEQGDIQVGYECRENATLSLTVEDTGPGIPSNKVQDMFKPFTQMDSSDSRQHEGAGMGLAIVQGLVDLLKGTIIVDSEVGRGMRIEVILPYESVHTSCNTSRSSRERDDRKIILVVDDHAEIRESFSEMLHQLGYDCDTSPDADDAISRLANAHYDAVLLDLHMPGKNGYDVVTELRKQTGPSRQIPVIVISAYPQDFAKPHIQQMFDEYLTKPIGIETLQSTLTRFLPSQIDNATH